jgi:DNA-binding transcriptional ArsR family regulator
MMAGMATSPSGDADVSAVATLIADPSRARVLIALSDGRALPASVLAAEAGVSAPAASSHLAKLLGGGLVTVERSGRHRYYRLASADVAAALEGLARIAPAAAVRSLRQGTRAHALRRARTCYDHLAGRLGVALTSALLAQEALVPLDHDPTPARRAGDPVVGQLPVAPYGLGPGADEALARFGVRLASVLAGRSARPVLRFCVDWSEQQHHLAGRLGAAVADAWFERGWLVRPFPGQRAVRLTDAGAAALGAQGLSVPADG